jgi:hypothetical protein
MKTVDIVDRSSMLTRLYEGVVLKPGDDLHVLGLQNVARCLGWVLSNEQFRERVENADRQQLAVAGH